MRASVVIGGIIEYYTHHRLQSSLHYLWRADNYRGNREALLAALRGELASARELRKRENLNLRQRRLPWTKARIVRLSKAAICLTLSETASTMPSTTSPPRLVRRVARSGQRGPLLVTCATSQ